MGGPRRGGTVLALAVGLGAATWWLWELYSAPNRSDLSAYWQLVLAAAALVLAAVTLVKDTGGSRTSGRDSGSERDRLADRLADAVQRQWIQAAAARRLLQPEPIAVRWTTPSRPVAGSAAAATASTQFAPLPGLAVTRRERLRGGELPDLHAVYGGLGSGRLVITGAPGSGKSGAAVLLVLAALRHRRGLAEADRANVPVPVLFTMHGWDPATQPMRQWLVSQIRQTYEGLFVGRRGAVRADRLIEDGKIAVVLDGLDEIDERLQALALRALSEQATFRLVVLARTAEIAAATEHAILDGAVAIELRNVDPATAADYLSRTQRDPLPPRWQELVALLRGIPDSQIARALSNPLTLTLVRDTYRTDDSIGELLDFAAGHDVSSGDIENHLLDRVLPQAYAQRPGQPAPPYSLATAHRALGFIATRLSRDNTRDLAWWRISTWTAVLPRVMITGLAIGLVVEAGFEIEFWGVDMANSGVVTMILAGLGGMVGAWLASRRTTHGVPSRWRFVLSHPSLVFVIGFLLGLPFTVEFNHLFSDWLIFGVLGWLVFWLVVVPTIRLVVGLVIRLTGTTRYEPALMRWRRVHRHLCVVLVTGLGAGFIVLANAVILLGVETAMSIFVALTLLVPVLGLGFGLGRLGRGSVTPLTPSVSWGRDRVAALGIWLTIGLLTSALLVMWGSFFPIGPAFQAGVGGLGLAAGLVLGLIFPETWVTSLACAQLAVRRRIPLRLMRFLDDAFERNILRAVGPAYQFRHARLQDRLTEPHAQLSQPPRSSLAQPVS